MNLRYKTTAEAIHMGRHVVRSIAWYVIGAIGLIVLTHTMRGGL